MCARMGLVWVGAWVWVLVVCLCESACACVKYVKGIDELACTCVCSCYASRPVNVIRLGETATYIMLVGQMGNTDSHSIAGVLVVCTHQALWVACVDDGVTAHCCMEWLQTLLHHSHQALTRGKCKKEYLLYISFTHDHLVCIIS